VLQVAGVADLALVGSPQIAPATTDLRFVAGFLTYLATVAFATSLGRWASRAFMIVNGVALLFLVIRGLQYPDPKALSALWYTSPGFDCRNPPCPIHHAFPVWCRFAPAGGGATLTKAVNNRSMCAPASTYFPV
jgi:hypothetical protein